MKKISAVIPLYNKVGLIARALDSILAQTVRPEEIIVIDDGSTDGSGEVVKNYIDPSIKLIRQENQGESAARNRGIKESKGELIAFLDADDEWKPSFLMTIHGLIVKYPAAGIYGTAYEIVDENGEKCISNFKYLPGSLIDGYIRNYTQLIFDNNFVYPINSSSAVIPKYIFNDIGYFAEEERSYEDLDLWFRIDLKYPIAWRNEKLAIYYKNAGNRHCGLYKYFKEITISKSIRKAIESGTVPENQVNLLKELAAFFQLEVAKDCLSRGDTKTAHEMLRYAKDTSRFARAWWKRRMVAALPGNLAKLLWDLKERSRALNKS